MSETIEEQSESATFTGTDGEPLTGAAERARFHGYDKRELPEAEAEKEKPEPKVYEGHESTTRAANDLTRARGSSEPFTQKVSYAKSESGRPQAVDVATATKDLSDYHKQKQAEAEAPVIEQLQQEIDQTRAVFDEVRQVSPRSDRRNGAATFAATAASTERQRSAAGSNRATCVEWIESESPGRAC